MNEIEVLLVGVEASIALAGFAGLVVSLQINDITNIRRSNVTALTVVLLYSLLSGLACSLALLLIILGFEGKQLWQISSVIMATLYLSSMSSISFKMKSVVGSKRAWYLYLILQGFGCLFPIALIFNSLGIIFHMEPGPFFAGLTYALTVAGYMFYRLLLTPLWRIVRLQDEAS